MGTCKMGYCGGSEATKTFPVKETMTSPESDVPCCDYCWGMAATEAIWDFLVKGDPPDGFVLPEWEPINPRQAMTVLYVIQEFLGALPDTWEMCSNCERLFNTGFECYVADEEHGILCENCMPSESGA